MPTVGGQSKRGPGDRAADGHYHRHDPVETGAEREVFGMRFGVLGTGIVGRSIAGGLAGLDHDVVIGTRDTAAVMARTDRDAMGNEPFAVWKESNASVKLGTFADAAAHGEMVVNATNGAGALDALEAAGEGNLDGKTVIDIANPLDFSHGMPPSLLVCNTDSLGERIQRAFPGAKVVKTLNTVTAAVMTGPTLVGHGDHTIFVSGNDAEAKSQVIDLLRSFGWHDVVDLGDITSARAVEMYLPLWVGLMGSLGTPMFNVKVVRAQG